MQLEFVTLAGPQLQDDVYEVVLPTPDGDIAVFAMHMPLVTALVPGVIAIRRKRTDSDDARDLFATSGGVAEITGKSVRLLVDEADRAEDIVEQEATEALERAKALKAQAKDQVELDNAQSLMDRHAVQLRVAELRRRTHRHRTDL